MNKFIRLLISTTMVFISTIVAVNMTFAILSEKDQRLNIKGLIEGTISKAIDYGIQQMQDQAKQTAEQFTETSPQIIRAIPLNDVEQSRIEAAGFMIFGGFNGSSFINLLLSEPILDQNSTSALFIKINKDSNTLGENETSSYLDDNYIVIVINHKPININNISESLDFAPERTKCFTNSTAVARASYQGDNSQRLDDGGIATTLIQDANLDTTSNYLYKCTYARIDLSSFPESSSEPKFEENEWVGTYSIQPQKAL